MRLKTSKRRPTRASQKKDGRTYVEEDLLGLARAVTPKLRAGDRILCDGPLGSGKSTLIRTFLRELGARELAEGSPTYSIIHVYETESGPKLVHIDAYRLTSEPELEGAGVIDALWDREAIVFVEWLKQFSEVHDTLRARPPGRVWEYHFDLLPNPLERRITQRVFGAAHSAKSEPFPRRRASKRSK